jgi:hypothetical protein
MKIWNTILICSMILIIIGMIDYANTHFYVMSLAPGYTISGSSGKKIPADIFIKTVTDDEDEKGSSREVDELIISFDDSLVENQPEDSKDEKLYKYIIIVPSEKLMGLSGDQNGFYILGEKLIQTHELATTFKPMVGNTAYYTNPPVKFATYVNNKVVFNSFGPLSRYGDSIVIEKNN